MAQKDVTSDAAPASDELRKTAEEHVRAGRHAEAADLYRKLVERHPGEDSCILALAWACHDDGRIEEAVACFEELFQKELSRKVFTGFAFDELVRIFKRQGRYDRLLDVCERAAAAQPGDFALLGDLAEACLKTGQPGRAASVYGKMLEMEPDMSVVLCGLGNARIGLGDFDGAEAAYEKAAAIDPEEAASCYCHLAEHYRRAGQRDRAVASIRKSLSREPREPAYHLILGDNLIEGGSLEEGWLAYETAISLRPASAGSYYFRLGKTLAGISSHDRAVAAFQRAVAAEPGNPFYLLNLAESYLAMGQEASALEALNRAKALE